MVQTDRNAKGNFFSSQTRDQRLEGWHRELSLLLVCLHPFLGAFHTFSLLSCCRGHYFHLKCLQTLLLFRSCFCLSIGFSVSFNLIYLLNLRVLPITAQYFILSYSFSFYLLAFFFPICSSPSPFSLSQPSPHPPSPFSIFQPLPPPPPPSSSSPSSSSPSSSSSSSTPSSSSLSPSPFRLT